MMNRRLRPYWGRITMSDSPVDEEQTESGLIVPLKANGEDSSLKRAVVMETHLQAWENDDTHHACVEELEPGRVVWYDSSSERVFRLGETVICWPGDIVALEETS